MQKDKYSIDSVNQALGKRVVVVVPTYDEKNNIIRLLDRIFDGVSPLDKCRVAVLIVDDNSPDGTAKLVEQYSKYSQGNRFKGSRVFLLNNKEKNGLGVAYIKGFKFALEKLKADVVVQMDADFSHNPRYLPRLISAILAGNDLVIGSRYMVGGAIPGEWPRLRKWNSRVANFLARRIAGLSGVYDYTSGFRAYSGELLRKINLEKIGAKGFSFQLNILAAILWKKASVLETPIVFIDRIYGKSKLRMFDIVEFVYNAFKLRIIKSKNEIDMYTFLSLGMMVAIIAYFMAFFGALSSQTLLLYLFLLLTAFVSVQGLLNILSMIYVWDKPHRIKQNHSPKTYHRPEFSFTAVVPAWHEENVIGQTIESLLSINYPENLTEFLIICRPDDDSTIAAVKQKLSESGSRNARLIVPSFIPKNKPAKLNIALSQSTKDVIVVFDAEDKPHKEIYNIVNTVMLNERVDVVQSGVQLINYRSHWYSTLNVLEYFFWYKSVLQLFSSLKVLLLGGNTVFFKRNFLDKIKGWDDNCLTEDADIAIRLANAGAKIKIIYDETHATHEETPVNISGFIKQRTRWNQGFIQIYKKYDWLQMPTFKQKFLFAYLLIWPEIQAFMFLYVFLSLFMMLTVKVPVIIALISFFPLYLLLMQVIIFSVGLYEFTRRYHLHYPWWMSLKIVLTFIPYQLVLGYSALRATIREISKNNNWEKTVHVNAHRRVEFERKPLSEKI